MGDLPTVIGVWVIATVVAIPLTEGVFHLWERMHRKKLRK
jgi:hypothetical protein